jgi:hypothetical protein
MRVSRLTVNGDWTFGKGRANYLRRGDAIHQNVVTRLRSFTDDWFLDTASGLPWYELLGSKGAQARMLREIERVILTTGGVRTLDRLSVTVTDRMASIDITLTDIFNGQDLTSIAEISVLAEL